MQITKKTEFIKFAESVGRKTRVSGWWRGVILKQNKMKATYKNGIFNFEIDGYAVELYRENNLWLDKVYTLFGHVVNRVSSEKSVKFSEVVDAIKADIQEAKQIETTIFK